MAIKKKFKKFARPQSLAFRIWYIQQKRREYLEYLASLPPPE